MRYFRRSIRRLLTVTCAFLVPVIGCGGEDLQGPGFGGTVIHVMGRATFSDGSAFTGAIVRLYFLKYDGGGFSGGLKSVTLGSDVTDSDGQFEITGMRFACIGGAYLQIDGGGLAEHPRCVSSLQVFDFQASPPPTL